MDAVLKICHTFPNHDKFDIKLDFGRVCLGILECIVISKALLYKKPYFHYDIFTGIARPILFKNLGLVMFIQGFQQSFGQKFSEIYVTDLQGQPQNLTYLWLPEIVDQIYIKKSKQRWFGYKYNVYSHLETGPPLYCDIEKGYERYGIIIPELLAYHEYDICAKKLQNWWKQKLCLPEYPRSKLPGLHYLRAMASFKEKTLFPR